ncbi:hypothetical protein FQN55_007763 [Onygenales sp. PD_40]|nr:hypothetical protein FQN55_007763 [Onygenales sp. PD_40]
MVGRMWPLFEKLSPGKRRKSGKGKNRVTVRLQVYIYYGDEKEGLTGRCNTITTKISRTAALFSTPEQSKIGRGSPLKPPVHRPPLGSSNLAQAPSEANLKLAEVDQKSPSLPEIPGPDGHYKADEPDGRYEQVAKNGQSSLAVRHGPSAQWNAPSPPFIEFFKTLPKLSDITETKAWGVNPRIVHSISQSSTLFFNIVGNRPYLTNQAIGRILRIGQTRIVKVYEYVIPNLNDQELDIDLDGTSLEAKSELTTRIFRWSKRLRALVPLMIDIVIREKEKAIIWCLVTTCRVANMRRVSWPNSTNNLPLSKPRPASETAKLSPLNSAMSIFYTFRQDTLLERADLLAGRTNKITEALVKLPAVDAPVLRPDAPQISWKRGTNVEAVLGQSRGQRKDLAKPCQPTRSRYCALRLRRSQGVFMLLPLATSAHH